MPVIDLGQPSIDLYNSLGSIGISSTIFPSPNRIRKAADNGSYVNYIHLPALARSNSPYTQENQYGALIARELHTVAELQEANRFASFEKQNLAFEQAYVARLLAAPGPEKDTRRRTTAVLAAQLGLYINAPDQRGRIPVASTLTTKDDTMDPATARALAEAMQTRGLRAL